LGARGATCKRRAASSAAPLGTGGPPAAVARAVAVKAGAARGPGGQIRAPGPEPGIRPRSRRPGEPTAARPGQAKTDTATPRPAPWATATTSPPRPANLTIVRTGI